MLCQPSKSTKSESGLRPALVDWLSNQEQFRWAWYLTQTCGKSCSDTQAVRQFKSLLAGCCSLFRVEVVFWGLELQPRSRRPHFHALVQGNKEVSLTWANLALYLQAYSARKMGWAKWKRFRPGQGAVKYVTKYILKPESRDWDIWTEVDLWPRK